MCMRKCVCVSVGGNVSESVGENVCVLSVCVCENVYEGRCVCVRV